MTNGREVFDGALDGPGLPLERRLAPAPQAGLVGQHLHEDPVAMHRVDDDGFDAGDLHVAPRASGRLDA